MLPHLFLALCLTLASAVCTHRATPRGRPPRLGGLAGWLCALLPLFLAVALLDRRLSALPALCTVLAFWFVALPLVSVLQAWRLQTGHAHHG